MVVTDCDRYKSFTNSCHVYFLKNKYGQGNHCFFVFFYLKRQSGLKIFFLVCSKGGIKGVFKTTVPCILNYGSKCGSFYYMV